MASNVEPIVWNETNQAQWVGIRPGYYGDQLTAYGTANAATTVLYTVGVGKVLLIFNTTFSVAKNIQALIGCIMWLRDEVPANIYQIHHLLTRGEDSNGVVSLARFSPLVATAGYSITVVSPNGNHTVAGTIEGVLVDA